MVRWLATRSRVVLLCLCLSLTACTSEGDQATDPPRVLEEGKGYRELQLNQPRAVHHATALQDGRVLFTGGCTLPGCEGFDQGRTTEVFDPERGSFEQGPTMVEPRASGTATLLDDGRVLLTGGYPGEGQGPTSTAEIYNPATNSFTPTSSMATPRANQTATLLPDGRVLIAGGQESDAALDTTELFDPETEEFSAGPELSQSRAGHAAVVVGERVLLVGGTQSEGALQSTDVLDGRQWAPGPDLLTGRVKLGAVGLGSGQVFVVGGASTTEGRERLRTTEIVDLRDGSSHYGPELSEGQYKLDGAVTVLDSGRVAVAGGDYVNVYDSRSNAMTTLDAPAMGTRSFISATAVGPATLLVAGGYDPAITPTDSAWLISIE